MIIGRKPELEALLRRPDPGLRGALIHGGDRSSVGDVARRLLERITERPDDPFDVAQVSSAEMTSERLDIELSALSLMGGRRVVRLRLAGELSGKEKLVVDALDDHANERAPSGAFLLIECAALDRRSALRKAAEDAPAFVSVALYEDDANDLGRLARDVLQASGLSATPAIVNDLASRLPRDCGSARQLLEAVILYAGPGSVGLSAEHIEAVLGASGESGASELALSAFSGRLEETSAALRQARFANEPGPAILRALSAHCGRLARAQAAISGGAAPGSALKSVGVFWKQEREVMEQLKVWRPSDLALSRRELLEADLACKSAGAPDELLSHNAAFRIARRANQRGRASGVG